jgi:myxalamid-type polyketide synthase MxaB
LDKIEKLRSSGNIRIEVRSLDVSDMDQLRQLAKEFDFVSPQDSKQGGLLPQLRGIMHAAGLLDDGLYENQSWDKYEAVFKPKVDGSWNLHQLSLELPFPLEHFVLFSSMTATIGAVAQSNYASSNQYLDSLIAYRNSRGLCGTAINWGQWGGVGLAANLHVALNKPLSIHQGTAALGHALTSHKTQVY